jgi:hypothetical protein
MALFSDNYNIYGLIDPISGELRYVGITAYSIKSRLAQHTSAGRLSPVRRWIRGLQEKGVAPVAVNLDSIRPVRESEAYSLEEFWTRYMKFIGADLLNINHNGRVYR